MLFDLITPRAAGRNCLLRLSPMKTFIILTAVLPVAVVYDLGVPILFISCCLK